MPRTEFLCKIIIEEGKENKTLEIQDLNICFLNPLKHGNDHVDFYFGPCILC